MKPKKVKSSTPDHGTRIDSGTGRITGGAACAPAESSPGVTEVVSEVVSEMTPVSAPTLGSSMGLTSVGAVGTAGIAIGVGSGESENTVPYGFDYARPVSRFEESLKVIRLLWDSDGPVDFSGEFYQLRHARMDTEPYQGRYPKIWTGASGPRGISLEINTSCSGRIILIATSSATTANTADRAPPPR